MTELQRVIMERDGLSAAEVAAMVAEALLAIEDGDDPEEVLQDIFGLEPDYLYDILGATSQ